jgi:hypothetical protein
MQKRLQVQIDAIQTLLDQQMYCLSQKEFQQIKSED